MIHDVISRTIKCDAEGCDKVHVFNPQDAQEVIALPDWIKTTRSVELGNRTKFEYCSDACEIKATNAGKHVVPEPPTAPGPKLVGGATQNEIRAAAIVETVGREQFKTLKTGKVRRS